MLFSNLRPQLELCVTLQLPKLGGAPTFKNGRFYKSHLYKRYNVPIKCMDHFSILGHVEKHITQQLAQALEQHKHSYFDILLK